MAKKNVGIEGIPQNILDIVNKVAPEKLVTKQAVKKEKKKRQSLVKEPEVVIPKDLEYVSIAEQEIIQEDTRSEVDKFTAKVLSGYYFDEHDEDSEWDIKIDDPIEFFDSELSYEITGYKPITKTRGLDFNPNWFTEAREVKLATGKYCEAKRGSKQYDDFWYEEYQRLNNGMTVNGYTITGDNYYFLNYYRLMDTTGTTKAGDGRSSTFPMFHVKQYEYFHYIDLCRHARKNAVGLKARGVGFSEIAAAIAVNTYSRRPDTHVLMTAQLSDYLDKTLDKCWTQLDYLNAETEGGLFKLRQAKNTMYLKRASHITADGVEAGWMSDITGIVADRPNKIRGDRVDILFYEESGSWPNWKKAFLQGDALVGIGGSKFGIKLGWGTGGDSGPALAGIADAFYHWNAYDILPHRHNYTKTGETALTAYFIPAYSILWTIVDERGWTDPELGKAYYQKQRDKAAEDPEAYLINCAEFCWTPDEALTLEGSNNFNRVLLVDQLAEIKQFKRGPKIQKGLLEYNFKGKEHIEENIQGFKFLESATAKLRILEHPLRDENGKAYRNLYVAGIDSIDHGMQDTSTETKDPSDFCIVIKRRQHGLKPPRYVAIYKDRPQDIRTAYMTALKLCEYYNCQANLENSKISLRQFFQEKNKANKYLMRRPRATMSDSQTGNSKQFGSPTTEVVIRHQLSLIAQYIEDYSNEIWFEDMLEESIHYSYENKRKFDIIAAWGMCELADEELSGMAPIPVDNISTQWTDIVWYTDENGYKKRGPKPQSHNINHNMHKLNEYDYTRPRTSDPRDY